MASLLFFEVMDKEPALWWFFLVSGTLGVVGFVVCRWKTWAALVAVPLCALFAYPITDELRDSFVGPAILHEAGYRYVIGAYIGASLSFVLPLLGLAVQIRRRRVHSAHV